MAKPSLTAWILDNGKPIRIGSSAEGEEFGLVDIPSDPDGREDRNESYLGLPVYREGNSVGVLAIQSYQKDAFSESDERLLSTLASSMSVALENARLFDETNRLLDETQKRNSELAILNNVGQAVSKKLEFQSIVDLIGDRIRETFGVETVAISFIDIERELIDVAYYVDNGIAKEIEVQPLPRPSLSAWIFDHGKPIRLGTLAELEEESSNLLFRFIEVNITSDNLIMLGETEEVIASPYSPPFLPLFTLMIFSCLFKRKQQKNY